MPGDPWSRTEVQTSDGSKDRMIENKQTDGRTDEQTDRPTIPIAKLYLLG